MHATLPGRTAAEPVSRPTPARVESPIPVDEDEAGSVVEGGEPVGIPSVVGVLKGIGAALAQPGPVTRGVGRLARDWASIARGTGEHLPSPRDKRFSDPAWSLNPLYRRIAQGYLARGTQLDRLARGVRLSGAGGRGARAAR